MGFLSAIEQDDGAGTGNPSLDNAWLDVAIIIGSGTFTVLDKTDGLTVNFSGNGSGVVRVTGTGGVGAARISDNQSVVRVIGFTKSSTGAVLAVAAPPTYLESPGERNGPRAYARAWDAIEAERRADHVAIVGGLPQGASQTLPDSDSTLTSARRARQDTLATLSAIRTQTVPAGSTAGERRTLRRTAREKTNRLRYVNADGSTVAIFSAPGSVEVEWDAADSRWIPLGSDRRAKRLCPEDFGDAVGIGNAAADTAAMLALRDAIYTYDPTDQASDELPLEVVFEAPEYLLNQQIDWRGTDYTAVRFRGVAPGWTGAQKGNRIRWVGATAARMSGTPTLTFNRAARTIVRATGSFVADGFTVGMRIYVGKPGSDNVGLNVRIFDYVSAVTATTLTIRAPLATSPAVPFDTAGMMPYDEVAAAGYTVTQCLSAFRFPGMSGVELRDLIVIDPDNKLLFPVHFDIEPDVPNATNLTHAHIEGCGLSGSANYQDAAVLAYGRPPSNPPVGSQCDTLRVSNCFVRGSSSYNTDHAARGIAFLDGSNIKDHWVDSSNFWSARVAIDHTLASETLKIDSCVFEDINGYCILNNGYAEVSNCQAERCARAIGGSTGRTTESNNAWNLKGATDNIVVAQRLLTARGSNYVNQHVYMTVTSVNAGTDTWTGANNNENARPPVNGDEVVLRGLTGEHSLPPGIDVAGSHWLANVAETGPGTNIYTFQLYRNGPSGAGGTLVDAISMTGNFYVMSPCVFAIDDLNKSGSTTDRSGISLDSCVIWGAENYPSIRGSAASAYTLDVTQAMQAAALTRSHVRNCFGNIAGNIRALREISSVPSGFIGCAPGIPDLLSFREDAVCLGQGLNTSGWTTYEFDWRRMKDGSGFLATANLPFLLIPLRCGILDVRTEVVPDENGAIGFAAPSLSALTVQVGIFSYKTVTAPDPDNLLTAHSILAGSFTNLSDMRRGFTNAERGVDLQFGAQFWPKETGATDYSWVGAYNGIQVLFTPTGAALSALTQGRLRLHLKLEQIPQWERT